MRVEDLGRIMVLLEHLLDHPLFTDERIVSESMLGAFKGYSEEVQEDYVEKMGENIEAVEYALERILDIARGRDTLNIETCNGA